jgi:hypothetical protein
MGKCTTPDRDANHLGLLVHDVVDEAGILMAEAVVVLPPDMGRQRFELLSSGLKRRKFALSRLRFMTSCFLMIRFRWT